MIQAIEGKIVADLYLWTTEERKLESSYKCIWLLLWDNLWRLEVVNSEEKEKFFLLIFLKIYITIIFQEISNVVSALRFLPVTDLATSNNLT